MSNVFGIIGELMETAIVIYLWYRVETLTKQIEERK
jgi:hypothetical protein